LDKGAIREGAPFLVRFLTQIASRFGVVVSQKIAAQTVAVVGAVGGAAVNLAFIEPSRMSRAVISPCGGSSAAMAPKSCTPSTIA
jgi:hypothetical protein